MICRNSWNWSTKTVEEAASKGPQVSVELKTLKAATELADV